MRPYLLFWYPLWPFFARSLMFYHWGDDQHSCFSIKSFSSTNLECYSFQRDFVAQISAKVQLHNYLRWNSSWFFQSYLISYLFKLLDHQWHPWFEGGSIWYCRSNCQKFCRLVFKDSRPQVKSFDLFHCFNLLDLSGESSINTKSRRMTMLGYVETKAQGYGHEVKKDRTIYLAIN